MKHDDEVSWKPGGNVSPPRGATCGARKRGEAMGGHEAPDGARVRCLGGFLAKCAFIRSTRTKGIDAKVTRRRLLQTVRDEAAKEKRGHASLCLSLLCAKAVSEGWKRGGPAYDEAWKESENAKGPGARGA